MASVSSHEVIAVIGMGCRFPGDANNPKRFWALVVEGCDAIVDNAENRRRIKNSYHPDRDKPAKRDVKRGGFLQESLKEFDAQCFGISAREAAILEPQQRLLSEVSQETLRGSRIGVDTGRGARDNQIHKFSPVSHASISIYRQGRADEDYCFVGSVKINLEHLEAAGIAGFLKAQLAITYNAIPPPCAFDNPPS